MSENVTELPLRTMNHEEISRVATRERNIGVGFGAIVAAASLTASVLAGTVTASIAVGKDSARIETLSRQREELIETLSRQREEMRATISVQRAETGKTLDAIRDSMGSLLAALAGTHADIEYLKRAIEAERQDRLYAETQRLMKAPR